MQQDRLNCILCRHRFSSVIYFISSSPEKIARITKLKNFRQKIRSKTKEDSQTIHLVEVVIDGKYRRANEPIKNEVNGACACSED